MKIFISYSNKDELFNEQLINHLSTLQRKEVIDGWCDKQLLPGENWDEEIKKALHECDLILFLVSPDLLSSDYIYNTELKISLERYEKGEVKIVPIILRPCFWRESEFGRLQALPKGAKALTTWDNIDEGYLSITEGLVKIIEGKEPFSNNKDSPKKKKQEKLSNINIGVVKGNSVINNSKKSIKQTINFNTKE